MVRAAPGRHGPSEVKQRPQVVRALRREQRRLAAHLRTLRCARGLSQEAAAERIGISVMQLGRLERGEANVTLATLVACALSYRIELSAMFEDPGE